ARLEILALQVPLLLQGAQVIVDAVGGPDAEVKPDLAQRGRIAPLPDRGRDEVQDLLLPLGQNPARVVSNQSERAHVNLLVRRLLNRRMVRNRCAVSSSRARARAKRAASAVRRRASVALGGGAVSGTVFGLLGGGRAVAGAEDGLR